MEKAFTAMRELGTRAAKVVLIFHFEGFGLRDCDPRLATSFATMIGNQYPERLHRLVLVDSPFLFEPIWTVVRAHPRRASPVDAGPP